MARGTYRELPPLIGRDWCYYCYHYASEHINGRCVHKPKRQWFGGRRG